MLFASLMKGRSMSYNEILRHSLPFLNALNNQINRIRIIEAGGDPDRNYDDEDMESAPSYCNNNEVESTLPDSMFYGQLNALLK